MQVLGFVPYRAVACMEYPIMHHTASFGVNLDTLSLAEPSLMAATFPLLTE
jgi:hypothetical protein